MKIINPDTRVIDRSDLISVTETYMGDVSLHLFSRGFLELAEMSVDTALSKGCSIDAVVPAVLYSYRHSVELFLKYIIYDLKIISETEPLQGHMVLSIFNKHKPDIECAFEYELACGVFDWTKWVKDFSEIIEAVHEFDPDGQMIRYPADKKLTPNLNGKYQTSFRNLENCFAITRAVYDRYDERNS